MAKMKGLMPSKSSGGGVKKMGFSKSAKRGPDILPQTATQIAKMPTQAWTKAKKKAGIPC